MRTLPFDVERCAARYDFKEDGAWCPRRNQCQRYMALTQWDKGVIPDYRGVPVSMGVRDCTRIIFVEGASHE